MLYLSEHRLSFNGELNDSKSAQHFVSHLDHMLEDIHHPPRCSAHESQVAAVNCSQGEELPGFVEHSMQKCLKFNKTTPFGPTNDKVYLQSKGFRREFKQEHRSITGVRHMIICTKFVHVYIGILWKQTKNWTSDLFSCSWYFLHRNLLVRATIIAFWCTTVTIWPRSSDDSRASECMSKRDTLAILKVALEIVGFLSLSFLFLHLHSSPLSWHLCQNGQYLSGQNL